MKIYFLIVSDSKQYSFLPSILDPRSLGPSGLLDTWCLAKKKAADPDELLESFLFSVSN